MSDAEVLGLTDDRERVLVRIGDETVEVSLVDIHRAERQRPLVRPEPGAALTPRVIQHRIRSGESAEQIAREAGWPYSSVARYEGPALAEREHHAAAARAALVDGQGVEALLAGHFAVPPRDIDWDAWLVSAGRWEVRASSAGRVVRLRWDPLSRRVLGADDASRRALKQAAAGDALTAVLRPVSTSEHAPLPAVGSAAAEPVALRTDEPAESDAGPPAVARGPEPSAARPASPRPVSPRSAKRARAEVPLWDDISLSVGGRAPEPPES